MSIVSLRVEGSNYSPVDRVSRDELELITVIEISSGAVERGNWVSEIGLMVMLILREKRD